eukprot:Gb_30274 [translate_table: standard]
MVPIFSLLISWLNEHYWLCGGSILAIIVSQFIFKSALQNHQCQGLTEPEPPGSYGWPLLGETLAFIAANKSSKGVYEFVRQRHQRFGDVFKTRIFGNTHVFMPRPEVAKLILSREFSGFTKSYIRSMREAVGDQSLLCVPEQTHKTMRHLLGDLFSAETMAKSLQRMDRLFIHTLSRWKHENDPINVLCYTLDMTLKVMCEKLMSLENDEDLQFVRKNADLVSDAMLSIPIKFPGTLYFRGMKARERLMDFFSERIARRRSGEEFHDDFLQCMINKHDYPEAENLTDIQIKDNILTLIIAGYTTTATAMMWAVKYLDENPDVQEKLRMEQQMIGKRKTADCDLTLEDVNRMQYASKVVREVLRMASIVSWMPRVALNNCNVGGFQIKKGWILNIDAAFIHNDPSIYNHPTEFNPNRFDESPIPYSFLAFGAGVRTCLGINLAKLMTTVFLHRLVTTYRWKVVDSDPSLEAWAHFRRLRSGCPITVTAIS